MASIVNHTWESTAQALLPPGKCFLELAQHLVATAEPSVSRPFTKKPDQVQEVQGWIQHLPHGRDQLYLVWTPGRGSKKWEVTGPITSELVAV